MYKTVLDLFKTEILSGFHNGNGIPYDKYNTRGIAHFNAKTTIAKLYIIWARGPSTHSTGHIPLCSIFLTLPN